MWKDIQMKHIIDFLDLVRRRERREAGDGNRTMDRALACSLERVTVPSSATIARILHGLHDPPGRQSGFRSSPSVGQARLTVCPEERFLSTTFFPLAQRFGCSPHPNALSMFLAGSVAAHLRSCPFCLAEHTPASYRSLLPLWTGRPHLTTCSVCQGDLTTCLSHPLSEEGLRQTQEHAADLEVLLAPLHKPLLEKQQAKLIGKQCMELRQRRDLLVPEVAHPLGRAASVVLDIDQVSRFRQATLDDYVRSAALLGCSLREIFDETSLEALLLLPSEEHLLAQAETAIHHVQTRGKAVRPGSIGGPMGMTVRSLEQYSRLKTLRNRCETERRTLSFDSQHEEDLIQHIEHTLKR